MSKIYMFYKAVRLKEGDLTILDFKECEKKIDSWNAGDPHKLGVIRKLYNNLLNLKVNSTHEH